MANQAGRPSATGRIPRTKNRLQGGDGPNADPLEAEIPSG